MPTGGGRGAKRVLEEFATLREQIRAGTSGVHDLELATDDDISRWRVRMKVRRARRRRRDPPPRQNRRVSHKKTRPAFTFVKKKKTLSA
jgi:hypothetical protein